MVVTKQVSSQLEWLATLQTSFNPMDDNEKYLRKTSIIATIGPKTNTVEMLQELRVAGMNIGGCAAGRGGMKGWEGKKLISLM